MVDHPRHTNNRCPIAFHIAAQAQQDYRLLDPVSWEVAAANRSPKQETQRVETSMLRSNLNGIGRSLMRGILLREISVIGVHQK
jgi:hypothetical protein